MTSPATRERNATLVAGVVLMAAVAGLYAGVATHDFVDFDDPLYVTANGHVRDGFAAADLPWAFTNDEAFLWHPLTWMSLLLDAELYGVERAGPFLATNVALHALNSALVLCALLALTARVEGPGRRTACVFVAGVFALHPVQVESVAWVSARKELLAAGFFAITLLAYARYVEAPSRVRYVGVALASALGAMAKGSHAALPFLLLLFDFWPLRRVDGVRTATFRRLVIEKLPLLAIQLAAVGVNLALASRAENVWGHDPPLLQRIAAVTVNLVDTLGRIVWPESLAIVYPNPLQPIHALPALPWVLAAGSTLLGVGALAVASARARPALCVGWLGFLLMLGPMMGVVPMGLRSPHDRYLMVPLLVLALGLAFGVRAIATTPRARRVAATCGIVLLLACAYGTHQQIPVWRNSDALFTHALAVAGDDPIVHYSYGTALARRGDVEEGLAHLERAIALHPGHADAHHNLGFVLLHLGEPRRGVVHLEKAVRIRPHWERALRHLGEARHALGDTEGALEAFERAVTVAPDSAAAHASLGMALLSLDRRDAAERALRAALDRDPGHAEARRSLDWLEAARARSGGGR